MRKSVLILAAILLPSVALLYIAGITFDWYGELENSGEIMAQPIPAQIREQQDRLQTEAAKELGVTSPKQILFGDLHVHTTFSSDAFRMSLPMVQGDGAHPPGPSGR